MNFDPTERERAMFERAPNGNLFWKRRRERMEALDFSEEQPRDEHGRWTAGESGSTSTGGGVEGHPASTRLFQRIAAKTGEPKEMVEVVPLTKELYDKHIRPMTSADPLRPGTQSPEKSTFEKHIGKAGPSDIAFVVSASGQRHPWVLGRRGFIPPGTRPLRGHE